MATDHASLSSVDWYLSTNTEKIILYTFLFMKLVPIPSWSDCSSSFCCVACLYSILESSSRSPLLFASQIARSTSQCFVLPKEAQCRFGRQTHSTPMCSLMHSIKDQRCRIVAKYSPSEYLSSKFRGCADFMVLSPANHMYRVAF
jgi:hypothetical protein